MTKNKIKNIQKREGVVVPFNQEKITAAVLKAGQAMAEFNGEKSKVISDMVVEMLNKLYRGRKNPPNVEEIQDLVEIAIMKAGFTKAAKAYILYRQEHQKIREQKKKILSGRVTKLPLSVNALKVIANRYLLHNEKTDEILETPEDMFKRVAVALAKIEKKYGASQKKINDLGEKFYEMMVSFEFLPAGRTLANAGTPQPVVSNCIVLHIDDSMEGIFQTLKDASLLQQAGSGLGFPFHMLRPAGSVAKKTRGVASGPVSFLKVYNQAFGVIKQQGRHGANMGVMRVDHPDILDFIHCKEKEGEINNFNISIAVTDEFMQQVESKSKEPWMCTFKGKKMFPQRVTRDERGVVLSAKEVKVTAEEIMYEIVSSAWSNGEPGIIFIDEVNRTNPLPGAGRIESCNPCVVGDTLVSTENGFVKIKELANNYNAGQESYINIDSRAPIQLYQDEGNTILMQMTKEKIFLNQMSRAMKTGVKEVYRLVTKEGYEVIATANHKLLTTEGWIPLINCLNKEILIQAGEGNFNQNYKLPFEVINEFEGGNGRTYRYKFPKEWSKELGQMLGWIVGDGWIRDKHKQYMVGFTFGKNDQEILKKLKRFVNEIYGLQREEINRERNTAHLMYGSKHFVDYIKKLGVDTSMSDNKRVPETIFSAPRDVTIGFLQALFTAEGTVRDNPKSNSSWIALTSKSKRLLQDVQLLLLNFGIKSQIFNRSRPKRERLFKYKNKKRETVFYGSDGILYELGIFSEGREKFRNQIGFLTKAKQKKLDSIRFKRFYKQNFTAKAIEMIPLGKKDVYNLTEPLTHSMICNGLVLRQCGEQFLHDGDVCNLGSLNLDKFVKDGKVDWDRLREVVRLGTRLLDNVVDITDFPVDKINKVFRSNRRIGLGLMGFADMLFQLNIPYNSEEGLKTASKVMKFITDESHKMSEELAKEKGVFPNYNNSIWKQKGIKMRNAATTTIAPTGSISMVVDVSSGLEPYFALAYIKEVMGGEKMFYTNRHLEKNLRDKEIFTERLAMKIAQAGTVQNIDEIPKDIKKVFIGALDITPADHVKMQAAFQKYVDNSISKTINFPNSSPQSDVLDAYILAWRMKCKASTVYREASRKTEVLSLVSKKDKKAVSSTTLDLIDPKSGICPECGGTLNTQEGCLSCSQCGFGLCSV